MGVLKIFLNNDGQACGASPFIHLITCTILVLLVAPNIKWKAASGMVLIVLLYVYKKAWDRFKKEEEESAKKYELEREAEEKAKKYNLNPTLFAMSALDQEKQNQDS